MNFSIEEYYSILIEILKSADEEDIPSQALIDAWRITEIYVQPVICVIGFLGNLTAARVFTSKNLRLNSSNLYLAFLSCFTSVYMLLVLLSWLAVVNVPVINQNRICQLVVFLTYVCSFMTVWLIAVITFEHYVIVHHIRAARFVCKRRKAKILVSCLIATSLLLYSTTLWSTRVEQRSNMLVCTPGSDQRALLTRLVFFIDMVVTFLLPGIITITIICACVGRHLLMKDIRVSFFRYHSNIRISRRERSLLRIARVLLLISLSHVVFSSPCFIFRLCYQISFLLNEEDSSNLQDYYINQILQNMYYFSFTANFIVYIAFCANFRLGLKSIFTFRRFKCSQHSVSETT